MRRIRRSLRLTIGLVSVVLPTAACTSPEPSVTAHPPPTSAVTALPTPIVTLQPTPTPPPTAPTLKAHEFVSSVYDFRPAVPKNWTGVDAQANDPWDGAELQGIGSTAFADFMESGDERSLAIGAAPVVMGTTPAEWQRAVVRAGGKPCRDLPTTTTTTLGDEPALTWSARCPGAHPAKYAVLHGARGYVALLLPTGDRMTAADLAVFGPVLRSFHFTS